ncbi:MAG: universal stress protein [Acidimicrobiales bacterium]|jgi:nucleotide-binding universal stress UspA family protein|nr:universal stress protein [Acidimicrobiales bacterium]
MYDYVIVPFDGSPEARRAAAVGASLSDLLGAHLTVVVGTHSPEGHGLEDLKAKAMSMSEEVMDVWVESASNPLRALENVVAHRPNALLCLASAARGGLSRLTAGSLAEQLVQHVDAPMLVLGPHCEFADPADMRELLVCLDGNPDVESVVPFAVDWAAQLGTPMTLVHVEAGAGDTGVEARERLERLAAWATTRGATVEVRVLHGDDPGERIVDTLRRRAGTLPVLAAHGRKGLARLRFGSVTADVVRGSPVPVLVHHAGLGEQPGDVAAPS